MEPDIKVQRWVPHILTRSNHSELRLLICKSKDACKECYADWLYSVKALSEEIHPDFLQLGIFWPAAKRNL